MNGAKDTIIITIVIKSKCKRGKRGQRNRKSEEETYKYNKLLIMIITTGMHNESSQRFSHFYRISER